jgi:hypothetical protein
MLAGALKSLDGKQRSAWSRFLIGTKMRHPDSMSELRAHTLKLWRQTSVSSQTEYEKIRTESDPATLDDYIAARDLPADGNTQRGGHGADASEVRQSSGQAATETTKSDPATAAAASNGFKRPSRRARVRFQTQTEMSRTKTADNGVLRVKLRLRVAVRSKSPARASADSRRTWHCGPPSGSRLEALEQI